MSRPESVLREEVRQFAACQREGACVLLPLVAFPATSSLQPHSNPKPYPPPVRAGHVIGSPLPIPSPILTFRLRLPAGKHQAHRREICKSLAHRWTPPVSLWHRTTVGVKTPDLTETAGVTATHTDLT